MSSTAHEQAPASPSPARNRWQRLPAVSASFGGYATVGGLLTLLGWFLDMSRLTDWDNNGISQMPNNALAMVAAGAALIMGAVGQRRAANVLGGFAGLIGAATFSQYITGIDLGIDNLLVQRPWGQRGTVSPGRMGPPGSVSLTIAGISIILIGFVRTQRFAVFGALSIIAIAMLSIVGYLFASDPLYTIPKLTTIAFQTSTMLLALGFGILAAMPERQPLALLLGGPTGRLLMGPGLLAVLVFPLVLGWLLVRGIKIRLFDPAFGTALLVLMLIAVLTGLLWWSGAAIRRHEATIRQSQARLAAMLGSITDAFMTFDADWRLVFVNPHAEARLGQPASELIGKEIWAVLPEAVGNEAHRQLHRSMAERISVEYELFYQPWQRWFAGRSYPTPDGGLALLSQDITARKQAEEELRKARERMQLAMTIANAATWDLDLNTGTLHWSDSHFTLLGREPTPTGLATSAMWQDAIISDDLPGVLAEWNRAERSGDTFRSEHRFQRADTGALIWVTSAGRFITDEAGKAIRFVGVFYDISERKRSEDELARLAAELRRQDRRKDEFLATLAHELRNPLAPLRTSLDVLKGTPGTDSFVNDALGRMDRQLRHLVRLIDDLLDVSRIASDKLVLRVEPVELNSIVHHAAETCAPLVRAGRHELTIAPAPEPIHLAGDPVRLAQVFANLLGNACKYTEPGGHIAVTVARRGREAIVAVRDDGVGITPDLLPKVFDLFIQAETQAGSKGGLGVGLTLVKRLIELHDGTVTARSDGPGKGSEFIVSLPVAAEPRAVIRPSMPTAEPFVVPGRRILVVDDNQDAAVSLAILLKIAGNEVETAFDGVEALEKAAAFSPDAILLDIGLPQMSGIEVCREIRKQAWATDVVIVALTGWGQAEDRRKSREAGFDGHLVKPVDYQTLAAMLSGRVGFE